MATTITDERAADQPLSSSEAVLWTIERDPTLRSTIIVVALLAQPPDLGRLRERLESAAVAFPRFRQRVQLSRSGMPRWVDVDQMDFDHHLERVQLPAPGAVEDLLHLAGRQAGETFDPARPLWQMTVVEGLEGGRAAVIIKVHHAMTDGVGGVGLLPAFTDPQPQPTRRRGRARRAEAPARSPRSGGSAALNLLRAVGPTLRTAVTDPVSMVNAAPRTARSVVRLLAPATHALSPITTARGLDRNLATLDVPTEGLARAGRAAGGTINDAFLAAVVGGLRRYHERHGVDIDALRVTMPISTRQAGDPQGGNRFTPARFVLPSSVEDPVERMQVLGDIARAWRHEPAVGLTNVLAGVLSHLPGEVTTSIFGSMLKGIDFVATNVPGTQERSWLAGAEVLRLYGFGPTTGAAVSVALLSHLDTCGIGINADTRAFPDPKELTACLAESFEEILEVGSRPHGGAGRVAAPPARAATASGRRQLSALDTSFLALESTTTPMHVGALILLDGGPLTDDDGHLRIDAIRDEIAARLHRCPRMRQRIAPAPFGVGRPVWVEDDDFDISHHVQAVDLAPPGSRQQLEQLCCELQMEVLDRHRPLWQMWFVAGLAGGTVGLVYKVHHAVVDGVSAAETFELLLAPETPGELGRRRAGAAVRTSSSGPAAMLRDSVAEALGTTSRLGSSGLAALRRPGSIVDAGRSVAHLLAHTQLAPSTSLNRPVGNRRRLATVELDVATIKRIGHEHGATVNDVVLALVASGVSELLGSRNDPVPSVQVLVPVSLRQSADRATPGNNVTALVAALPVGDRTPAERLADVVAETTRIKSSPDGTGLGLLLRWADSWPMPLLSWTSGLVHHQPFVNVVVTNVRGAEHPLELLGAELTEIIPIVPLGGNLTLGVAVLSYRGQLAIGLHADADAVGDLDVLAAGIQRAFDTLAREGHVSQPARRSARTRRGATT